MIKPLLFTAISLTAILLLGGCGGSKAAEADASAKQAAEAEAAEEPAPEAEMTEEATAETEATEDPAVKMG